MVEQNAFEACKIGDIETLKRLQNVHETLVDGSYATCLHYAARGGSIPVVEYLVKSLNFSVSRRTKTGATPLHDAAAKGNTAIVKWLVEEGNVEVNDQDGAGITALHLAALYRHILTVEWLLDEADADVSVRSGTGAVPLHFAVVGGDLNCVNILVDENPRLINMQMNNGATPVYMACQNGYLEVLKYLVGRNGATKIKAYDGMSCLHAAAQLGHLEVVKWLVIEEKCNPHDRDFDGATPLHYAASKGQAEVVRWMMREGGTKVTLDNLGGSPLHNAAELGELQCVHALLDCGCDVTLTDNEGLTADELADKCDQPEAAALIRGEITLSQLDQKHSASPKTNNSNQHLHSPRLNFPPPPPFPPEDLDPDLGITTHTASTNTSFSHLPPSPPLPPLPTFSPPRSTPSTSGSPITPPTPIHEEENEPIAGLGAGHRPFAIDGATGEPIIRRTVSRVSVDSSASNFGVIEQPDAGVLHTVIVEVHKTPQSVPPTPRPANSHALPGLTSHNSTQESFLLSGSNSSFSHDESDSSLDRQQVRPEQPSTSSTGNNHYIYGSRGLVLLGQHRQQQLVTPSSSLLAPASKEAASAVTSEPAASSGNRENTVSSSASTENVAGKNKIPKTPYYATPFKTDFNTGTKSAFARAKALFEYNKDKSHICPDNGEICTTAEREYFSSKANPKSSKMEPSPPTQTEKEIENHVGNGSVASASGSSTASSGQNPAKSVINIHGGHVTIIATNSKKPASASAAATTSTTKAPNSNTTALNGSKQGSAAVITPLRSNPVAAHVLQAQKDNVLKELQRRSQTIAQPDKDSSASATSQPLVNGHADLNPSHSASSGTSSQANHSTVNGGGNTDRHEITRPVSRHSSGSSTSSQPINHAGNKHDLIADIHSAVSGASNLSLRRAKSRGDGVSMVYQSKKGGAGPGEAKTDAKQLTGDFDPKNFLDKVEKVDSSGRAIPEWRRHVLAKHMAEKAQKEFEEKKVIEDYEARFRNMPAWKRALIERKEAQAREEEAAAGKK